MKFKKMFFFFLNRAPSSSFLGGLELEALTSLTNFCENVTVGKNGLNVFLFAVCLPVYLSK